MKTSLKRKSVYPPRRSSLTTKLKVNILCHDLAASTYSPNNNVSDSIIGIASSRLFALPIKSGVASVNGNQDSKVAENVNLLLR
jgi:hypothetical protein